MENEYKTGGYIYVKKQAFDFWKTYIEFLSKGMIDVPMPNPAIEFLADVKAGNYVVKYTWGNNTYKVQYYKGTIYNKERYDKTLSKAYLEGRYGAIPVFSNFDLTEE